MTSHAPAAAGIRHLTRITSPESLVAAVPHLLGFQPGHCLVVVATDPDGGLVRLTLRYDLPAAGDTGGAAEIARHAAETLAKDKLHCAEIAAYGPAGDTDPAIRALAAGLSCAGIFTVYVIRVDSGQFWTYLHGGEPAPLGGTALDGTPETPGVLASRDELAAQIAPAEGPAAAEALLATRRAAAKTRMGGASAAARAGQALCRDLTARYQAGGPPVTPAEAGQLTVALRDMRVRDDAWARMIHAHREAHQRLWADVTRLARPGYVAAPASLLAFTAWQAGDGAVASIAADRALTDTPGYVMAGIVLTAATTDTPFGDPPMTPDEVADTYAHTWDPR